MKPKRSNIFSAIRTEGALLPADFLLKVSEGDPSVPGLSPSDFHLLENERLNEAINRSWNRLITIWKNFKKRHSLFANRHSLRNTRERWLLPLFQELGYGRLTPSKAIEIEGKIYPISHFWNNVPIHLLGIGIDLDRRTPGVHGAARQSPHSLVQEFLNRSDAHLWAFVSNGLRLRILRDNVSLTRQAYVEFDLEAIMDGEIYSDFAVLWLLCHQSRVEGDPPEECWLERWTKLAYEQGTRALEHLREGVRAAINALGTGLLSCPQNTVLRKRLKKGDLSPQDFYRQLLRFVYRLIFLFVAEDRGLLLVPEADKKAKEIYNQYYSTKRLRKLAETMRGSRHVDLGRMVFLIFEKLDTGCKELALPALGSFLWSKEAIRDLAGQDIENRHLLSAIRYLSFIIDGATRRPIDYRNIGSEELGSIYESLLEFHPELNIEAGTFEIKTSAGHERKSTGSYYTPTSLINSLLDTALEPVVEARLAEAKRMANGEWRMGNGGRGKWILEALQDVHSILSGSSSMEKRNGIGGDGVFPYRDISQRGTIWSEQPDETGGSVNSVKYSGGMGKGDKGIHTVFENSVRKSMGTGDPTHPEHKMRDVPGISNQASSGDDDSTLKTDFISSEESEQINDSQAMPSVINCSTGAKLISQLPFAIRYSLFAEKALLSLKICDPACGSGHFLIAAAHRLAKRLASIRTGDAEPGPDAQREALRDVISKCIYGVDINPMAVELCKVNLWMEALVPGRPLSFIDHHIKCGNSLLGATPALIRHGIPDDAFKPVEGDDKKFCASLRKANKHARKGQTTLWKPDTQEPWRKIHKMLAQEFSGLAAVSDESIECVREKEAKYGNFLQSHTYTSEKLIADAWCAAFVWKKTPSDPYPLTEETFRKLKTDPSSLSPETINEIERLAKEYQFFHWHIEFPDVFSLPEEGQEAENEHTGLNGGFDVVLGNPPWERIKLQEKEFFSSRDPQIAKAKNKAKRERLIKALTQSDPELFRAFHNEKRKSEAQSHFIRNSGCYPLCGRGDVNTYSIFAELKRDLMSSTGRVGCIVPSGIATDDTTKFFFQSLMEKKELSSLYDFENRSGIFPGVHRSYKFSLLTMTGRGLPAVGGAEFAFFLHDPLELKNKKRRFTLSARDIALINPNTKTCPIFRTRQDAELTKAIYRRVPVLVKEGTSHGNPWGISFMAMFHMSNDSHLFRSHDELVAQGYILMGNIFIQKTDNASMPHSPFAIRHSPEAQCASCFVPLYEAKMIHHFNHRYGDYCDLPKGSKSTQLPEVSVERLNDPNYTPLPRYWVPLEAVEERLKDRWDKDWLIGWRRNSRSTDDRTFIVSLFPCHAIGDSLFLFLTSLTAHIVNLNANLSTYIFDYIVRQKLGGTNNNFFIVKQLPVLPPSTYTSPTPWAKDCTLSEWLLPRVLELTYTSWDLKPFAEDCGYDGPPFPYDIPNNHSPFAIRHSQGTQCPPSRRFLLRSELDAAFFHLYLGTQEEWVENAHPRTPRIFPYTTPCSILHHGDLSHCKAKG